LHPDSTTLMRSHAWHGSAKAFLHRVEKKKFICENPHHPLPTTSGDCEFHCGTPLPTRVCFCLLISCRDCLIVRQPKGFVLIVPGANCLAQSMLYESCEVAMNILNHIKITPRDSQVLKLLVQGCSNQEIAGLLSISPRP
jgi:hypothetical protein